MEQQKHYRHETVQLRAKSIQGQLDGTIPSTDEGQRQDSAALVDASHSAVHDALPFFTAFPETQSAKPRGPGQSPGASG